MTYHTWRHWTLWGAYGNADTDGYPMGFPAFEAGYWIAPAYLRGVA